jgi:iron-sulfur cluster repair protein YtfE (RIC family)
MFREIGTALEDATAAFRNGTATAQDFRAWFPSRLQFFLQQLNAHHQIEDLHYFPVFQAAEARLAHGFEVLEADHKAIHESIVAAVETANAFLRAPVNDTQALHAAGERYAAAGDALTRQLTRHLDDEEDLIIPLILDRTEAGLGVG